ncbi:MAG: hypothetical protein C0448_10225 [Sphingobacteriaceae bacterium]|nr:hypothetical protein [Sphingobacteriaceae bacterium]
MIVKEELYTVKELDFPEVNLQLKSNDIVYVTFKDNCNLDIPLQMRLLDYYYDITDGKLMHFMFFAAENVSLSKEARDNAVKIEDQSMLGATAVVVDTLAYKLIANFYLKFNKPKRPYQVFSKEEDAIKWLKTIKF